MADGAKALAAERDFSNSAEAGGFDRLLFPRERIIATGTMIKGDFRLEGRVSDFPQESRMRIQVTDANLTSELSSFPPSFGMLLVAVPEPEEITPTKRKRTLKERAAGRGR
jgi:hypothetical protein